MAEKRPATPQLDHMLGNTIFGVLYVRVEYLSLSLDCSSYPVCFSIKVPDFTPQEAAPKLAAGKQNLN